MAQVTCGRGIRRVLGADKEHAGSSGMGVPADLQGREELDRLHVPRLRNERDERTQEPEEIQGTRLAPGAHALYRRQPEMDRVDRRFAGQDESLQELELDLGLPKGFCFKLLEEDDWSFVIKLHALLESAVSELITRARAT